MSDQVLIIGGAGYIGSHMAKLLTKRGYEPVILDDLSTGHAQAAALAAPMAKVYNGSYADRLLLDRIFATHKIATVMHFGAKSLVGESVENPLLYYAANVAGTIALLESMRRNNIRHIVFSSTCATFGEPDTVPIHERVRQAPINPYGQSKLFVEKILGDVFKTDGISSAILRYFNAAGADLDGLLGEDHQPETHLIPRALMVLLGKSPKLTVFGKDYPTPDGSCIRDYVHVNDLGEAHILAMERIRANAQVCDYNLGTENGYSVFEVIQSIERVTGQKLAFEVGARRPGDPPKLVADSRKAREELRWKPTYDLDAIVRSAWNWMQKHPNGYGSAK